MKKFIEILFFVLGLALFGLVIRSVGLDQLKVLLPVLSHWGWILFVMYPFMCVWDVLAWQMVFDKDSAGRIHFGEFFLIG